MSRLGDFWRRARTRFPGVRHVAIHADDPADVAKFYRSTLDLEEVRRRDDGSILLGDGDVSLLLTPRRTTGP